MSRIEKAAPACEPGAVEPTKKYAEKAGTFSP